MQADFCFNAIVRVTPQMHGEITALDVMLLSGFPRAVCCHTQLKSFSFIKKTVSNEAPRQALACAWETGSL